jgi:hypothetical protein
VPKPSVADYLLGIAAALAPLKVRWYVFGAQAVIAAGAVRQTADIDITTDDVPVPRLLQVFRRAGFTLREDIEGVDELIEHHRILPMVEGEQNPSTSIVITGPSATSTGPGMSVRNADPVAVAGAAHAR